MEQLSPEWFDARKGKLTASRIWQIMPGKRGPYLKGRDDLMSELRDQILGDVGEEPDVPATQRIAMDHGIQNEGKARSMYEVVSGNLVEEVGFYLHSEINGMGASPDGKLILEDRLIEIKCPFGRRHSDLLELKAEGLSTDDPKWVQAIDEKYRWQMCCQMECFPGDIEGVDFVSFDPRKKPGRQIIIISFQRNQELIDNMLDEANKFLTELHIKVQKMEKLDE
jgi:hypothetical protein